MTRPGPEALRSDASNRPPLALVDVGMAYRDAGGRTLRVLSALDLTVSAGEMVCLAGRSGSGKTTAIMIAAGLLSPTEGSVRWGALDLTGLSADHITRERGRGIGIVFQGAALIASLRAGENVALPGMAGDGARADALRVDRLLEAVGMTDRSAHYPAQLSGGEQQRVALARGLYRDPPLLLVDEPTANLDRAAADGVISILDGLRREGRALLVASHDPGLVSIADRVHQME